MTSSALKPDERETREQFLTRRLAERSTDLERLRSALEMILPFAIDGESPGGCTGAYHEICEHCAAIKEAQEAVAQSRGLKHGALPEPPAP